MNVASFFGTDGIRGLTSLEDVDEATSIARLENERTLTPAFMRLVGEALSYTQPALPGEGNTVVIGWDQRPHNAALVASLTLGLRLTGSRVVHIDTCATPTLHHAVLAFKARIGCMITASHNPVSDSGIKVFDTYGYKSTRAYENEVSQTVRQLAEEDREVDLVDRENLSSPDEFHAGWGLTAHPIWMAKRWEAFSSLFGAWDQANSRVAPLLFVDGANGFAASWLVPFLTKQGVTCRRVDSSEGVLNHGCGAGDFSPTQTWTFEEAAASKHALIGALPKAEPGQLVGVALDGDGDRCLFVEATLDGFAIVDGDAMAAMLLGAGRKEAWHFAASIESDVALLGHVRSLNNENRCAETAVGDRWLSFSLRPDSGGWLQARTMPAVCGIEDSGHVVLPAPHPHVDAAWGLVGDGAATLCAVLLAASSAAVPSFERGWKQRNSIKESHRERWKADAPLFSQTEHTLLAALQELGFEAKRRRIEGEEDLLLIHGKSSGGVASFGVRNSGTQAKTSLSVRLSRDVPNEPFIALLAQVQASLTKALTED
jgi:phosphoglucosamine mutase